MIRPAVLLISLSLAGMASATQQLTLGDASLALTAQARACYLGFIRLYDIEYFARGPREQGARCVQVSYLRNFSAEELGEATLKVFRKRHGDDLVGRYQQELGDVGAAYLAVQPGDRYTYCTDPAAGGVLLRDGTTVAQFGSSDFAARFLQIWVERERDDGLPEWSFGQC